MDDSMKLTEEQAIIVNSDAPLKRIIACAGSGKTRVITSNIIKLVGDKKCRPGEILALTFTKNAAGNMRKRIIESSGDKYGFETMDIHTFNSFGNEIISENSFELGLGKDFKLISTTQSWKILYEIFPDFQFNHLEVGKNTGKFIQDLMAYIEYLKNNLVTVDDFRGYMENMDSILGSYKSKALLSQEKGLADKQQELFEIYLRYEKIKTRASYIDYADQVFLPYYLLLHRKSIRARYQARYRYIFVDEFQDTNIAQAHLLSLLFKAGENNITIVGDDDQGIYSFRGACIDNILNFHNWDAFRSAGMTDYFITGNFRSGSKIVSSIDRLISHNSLRFKKKLYAPGKEHGSEIAFFASRTLLQEAEQIANIIKWMSENGVRLKDMAIIFRRKRFKPFTRELEKMNIRYELAGEKNYMYDPAILFLVSWLKIICDFSDELSVVYLLRSPKYRIGDRDISFLKKGYAHSGKKYGGLIQVLADAENNSHISSEARVRIKDFIVSLGLYISKSHELKLNELINFIFEDSGMSDYLRSKFGWSPKNSIKNVEKIIRIASDFEQGSIKSEGLASFITYLEDLDEMDSGIPGSSVDSTGDSVRIMSIHAAKGLEFRVVFIPMLWKKDYLGKGTGKSSSIIPAELRKDGMIWRQKKDFTSERAFRDSTRKIREEEERRVFYVACSRAKEALILSHSEYEDNKVDSFPDKEPGEIVPFFYDIAGDSSAGLKILNNEALDYLKDSYGSDYPVTDYKKVFGFLMKGSYGKKVRMPVYDWAGAGEKLYYYVEKSSGNGLSGFKDNIKSLSGGICPEEHIELGGCSGGGKAPDFYSLTSLLDYIKCSSLYKWRYIFQIPGPADESLLLGEDMHMYMERITGLKYTYPEIGSKAISHMLKNFSLRDHIEGFFESRFMSFEGIRELRLEQLFYWKLKNCFITGKFDRVNFMDDGTVEIIDYKLSGGGREKKVNERYSDQLKAYALAVSEIYKVPPRKIYCTLYYLKENREDRLTFDEAGLKDFKLRLLGSINGIEGGDFKGVPGPYCLERCPYYELCSRLLYFGAPV
ncbi:MAG: ATP-dependent helicase [Actinobacteria bacterium]|nr:ATP-dependent helicase [Actinomycetota bacterium]